MSTVTFALFAAISMAFEMGWKILWPASCENLLLRPGRCGEL